MKNLKNALIKQKMEIAGSILLLVIFVLPFFSFASSRKDIFVSASATEKGDGTKAHPYHTISEALDNANSKTDVHVLKGVYKNSIEIPEGVRVFGSNAGDVILRPGNDKKVVVSMTHDSEINKVTIEKGKNGIWVKGNAKVSIIDCIIRKNSSDGIKISEGKVKSNNKVNIIGNKIKYNGRSGIFSGKRKISIIDNDIIENESDGIDLVSGTSAWIEKNEIKNNRKSGIKLILDGSDIWTKNNSIRNNGGEGIEISAYEGTGRIDINKSKIIGNDRYGIAKIARARFAQSIWNGLTVQSNTSIEGNVLGAISRIIPLF